MGGENTEENSKIFVSSRQIVLKLLEGRSHDKRKTDIGITSEEAFVPTLNAPPFLQNSPIWNEKRPS